MKCSLQEFILKVLGGGKKSGKGVHWEMPGHIQASHATRNSNKFLSGRSPAFQEPPLQLLQGSLRALRKHTLPENNMIKKFPATQPKDGANAAHRGISCQIQWAATDHDKDHR